MPHLRFKAGRTRRKPVITGVSIEPEYTEHWKRSTKLPTDVGGFVRMSIARPGLAAKAIHVQAGMASMIAVQIVADHRCHALDALPRPAVATARKLD